MGRFHYKRAAIFTNKVAALYVADLIQHAGISDIHLIILQPSPDHADPKLRRQIIREGIYGSAGGAIGAAIASLGAVSFKITIFATHPFLTGLAAVGYCTLLGGTGSALYCQLKSGPFLQALDHALKNGHWVVIVHSASRATDQIVNKLLIHNFTEKIL